jgi:hypothetical protein
MRTQARSRAEKPEKPAQRSASEAGKPFALSQQQNHTKEVSYEIIDTVATDAN